MRRQRVLGLSLGTKKVGIAVIERNSIYYCQMKSFKASWSAHKLQAIIAVIERYSTLHNVSAIALKIPPAYSHTPAIFQLLHSIQALTSEKQIRLSTFTMRSLQNAWSVNDQKMNKKQLMEAILDRYNLMHIYQKEQSNKNRHYEKIFEAVGAADIVLREQQKV
jgi:ribosome-interacting GTPase 1